MPRPLNHLAALVAAALALSGAPATGLRAQSPKQPLMLPARDVDVTYEIIHGGRALPQRMRWLAASRMLRIDPPVPDLFVIVDYERKRVSMIREKEHAVVDLAAPANFLTGLQSRLGSVVRQGEDRVLGLPCIEWGTKDLRNEPAEACITADGLLLRVKSKGQVVLTAANVQYGPQEPALFRIPDGYRHLSPESLPGIRLP